MGDTSFSLAFKLQLRKLLFYYNILLKFIIITMTIFYYEK